MLGLGNMDPMTLMQLLQDPTKLDAMATSLVSRGVPAPAPGAIAQAPMLMEQMLQQQNVQNLPGAAPQNPAAGPAPQASLGQVLQGSEMPPPNLTGPAPMVNPQALQYNAPEKAAAEEEAMKRQQLLGLMAQGLERNKPQIPQVNYFNPPVLGAAAASPGYQMPSSLSPQGQLPGLGAFL